MKIWVVLSDNGPGGGWAFCAAFSTRVKANNYIADSKDVDLRVEEHIVDSEGQ